ncbi:MAG TPA: hypothetical protein PLG59_03380, partial [bacterium]|nr:hypothetical protein [bacterium]
NRMTTLVLGSHPVLERLWCTESQLESLDVSRCPALRKLYLQSNRFENIPDLTNNPVVDTLDIRENRLDLDDIDAIRKLKNRLPAPIYSDIINKVRQPDIESGFIYSPQQSGDLLLPDAEKAPNQREQ